MPDHITEALSLPAPPWTSQETERRNARLLTPNSQETKEPTGKHLPPLAPFPQPLDGSHLALDGSGLLGFCASAPVMFCTAVFLTNSDPLWQTPVCIYCHWLPPSVLFFPLVFHHSPLSHQAFSVNGQTVNVSASTGHMVSNTMTQLHPCSLKAGGNAVC